EERMADGPEIAEVAVAYRRHDGRGDFVDLAAFRDQGFVNALQIGASLLDRDSGFQPPDAVHVVRRAVARVRLERHPEIGQAWKYGFRRENADHRVSFFIQLHDAAQHIAVGLKLAAPEGVSQQDNLRATWLVLLRSEVAADGRLEAKHIRHL